MNARTWDGASLMLPWSAEQVSAHEWIVVDCESAGLVHLHAAFGVQAQREHIEEQAHAIVLAVNSHAALVSLAERVAAHFEGTDAPLGIEARATLELVK